MNAHATLAESGSEITYRIAPLPAKHSGIGLASLILSVLAALFTIGVVGAGVFAELKLPGGVDGINEDSLPFEIAMGVLLLGYSLACVGVGLGVGGIIHPHRKRTWALLGLSFNGMIVLMFMSLLVAGVLFG